MAAVSLNWKSRPAAGGSFFVPFTGPVRNGGAGCRVVLVLAH